MDLYIYIYTHVYSYHIHINIYANLVSVYLYICISVYVYIYIYIYIKIWYMFVMCCYSSVEFLAKLGSLVVLALELLILHPIVHVTPASPKKGII